MSVRQGFLQNCGQTTVRRAPLCAREDRPDLQGSSDDGRRLVARRRCIGGFDVERRGAWRTTSFKPLLSQFGKHGGTLRKNRVAALHAKSCCNFRASVPINTAARAEWYVTRWRAWVNQAWRFGGRAVLENLQIGLISWRG